MPQLLKNTILTLIALGLLCGFQASVTSDFAHEKSAIIDANAGEESPEKENCELENWKFFSHQEINLKILKASLHLEIQQEITPSQIFASVPTSPPNS